MNLLTISRRDILEIATSYTSKGYDHALVLVHASFDPGFGDQISEGKTTVRVAFASTTLALRYQVHALAATRSEFSASVVLTPLEDSDIPLDVADQLTRRIVIRVDPSTRLKSLFSATKIRSGVLPNTADALRLVEYLSSSHSGKIRPAPAGTLDRQHLMREVIRSVFGDVLTRLEDLLKWSIDASSGQRWAEAASRIPEAVLRDTLAELTRIIGPTSGLVTDLLASHGPQDLLTFGIVAEMLLPHPDLDASFVGERREFRVLLGAAQIPTEDVLRDYAHAATTVAKTVGTSERSVARAISAAEELVKSSSGFANPSLLVCSSLCHGGFSARAEALAQALDAPVATIDQSRAHLRYQALCAHVQATPVNTDRQAAEAALRLVAFHRRQAFVVPSGLADWTRRYLKELSWYDAAVNHAWSGGTNQKLSNATRKIAQFGSSTRQGWGRTFAAETAHRAAQHPLPSQLGVEDVLDKVVAPLVDDAPVLLVVMDGMSVAASNSIVSSILEGSVGAWQIAYPQDESLSAALAALPTVTSCSRTSLLSGRLVVGNQATERKNFAAWFAHSLKKSDSSWRAALYHKGALANPQSDEAMDAVSSVDQFRFVATVINTIDDSLDKADPMGKKWQIHDFPLLESLLRRAAEVGRTVVLASDHGHVVERHLSEINNGSREKDSARWRQADSTATEQEVRVAGNRVLCESGTAILAVDEDLRYTARKAGYHGGFSPEELITPIIVLSQTTAPHGYELGAILDAPSWWEIRDPGMPKQESPKPETRKHGQQESLDVFGKNTGPRWVVELGESKMFRDRVRSFAIGQLSKDQAIDRLRAIDDNNGRLPLATFREAFGLSGIKANGEISILQKFVNIDGVEVLAREGSDITLNTALLVEQFGLKG